MNLIKLLKDIKRREELKDIHEEKIRKRKEDLKDIHDAPAVTSTPQQEGEAPDYRDQWIVYYKK